MENSIRTTPKQSFGVVFLCNYDKRKLAFLCKICYNINVKCVDRPMKKGEETVCWS